jgi:hypothetical protein
VLDVSPVGYALAARTIGGEVATVATCAAELLGSRLGGCYGMAGSDDSGAQWGAVYDAAASAALSATTAAADAAYCVAALLEQTGINYAGAEAACVPWESAAESEMRWARSSAPSTPVLPSAVGGGVPEPAGWSMLQHAIGRVWPNGHQDKLHTAASVWRAAASSLDAMLPHFDGAIGEVLAQRAPEVDDAVEVMRGLRAQIVALGSRYRDVAGGCDEYAHHLDQAHSAIVHECVEFVDITIAAETAGGLLAVVTVGLSEVAANGAVAVAAVRIGRTIADIIDALAAAVVSLAAELDAAAAGIATVEREMAPMLARRAEVAEVVRPGVIGQVGPVADTTPSDLTLARLATMPASITTLPFVNNPKWFKPESLEGMNASELSTRVPGDWSVRQTKSGNGIVFTDPVHSGRTIRIMPGYSPDVRPGAINHGPYVVVAQNSKKVKIALAGNPTLQ